MNKYSNTPVITPKPSPTNSFTLPLPIDSKVRKNEYSVFRYKLVVTIVINKLMVGRLKGCIMLQDKEFANYI